MLRISFLFRKMNIEKISLSTKSFWWILLYKDASVFVCCYYTHALEVSGWHIFRDYVVVLFQMTYFCCIYSTDRTFFLFLFLWYSLFFLSKYANMSQNPRKVLIYVNLENLPFCVCVTIYLNIHNLKKKLLIFSKYKFFVTLNIEESMCVCMCVWQFTKTSIIFGFFFTHFFKI